MCFSRDKEVNLFLQFVILIIDDVIQEKELWNIGNVVIK